MTRYGLMAGALCLAIATAAGAREAKLVRSPHYHDGKVAFSYMGDIWTAREDGTGVVRLTVNKARDIAPRFSPDGRWIAFSSDRDGGLDIYRIPAAGGEVKRLTVHSADDLVLGWTRDSQSVLFSSQRGEGWMTKLYTVSIEGGMAQSAGPDMGSAGSGDAVGGGGVGGEELGHEVAHAAGTHDEKVRGAGGGGHWDALGPGVEFLEAVDQGVRTADVFGGGGVGGVFARTGDGHLDEGGGQGGEDDHGEFGEDVAVSVVVAAAHAAEDHAPLGHTGEHGDSAGKGCGDGAGEDVAVEHVAQFVGDDAFEFVVIPSIGRMPAVKATEACLGLRPVAKALGDWSGMRSRGVAWGCPYFRARPWTMGSTRR